MSIIKLNQQTATQNAVNEKPAESGKQPKGNNIAITLNETTQTKNVKNPSVLRVDDKNTTEFSKTYVLNNNTRKMVVYPNAINYYDETEKAWKSSTNAFIESNGEQISRLGKYQAKISPNLTEEISISGNGKRVGWAFNGNTARNRKNVSVTSNNQTGKALYKNVIDGIDVEYIAENDNLKENIIVNKKLNSYKFPFTLNVENLSIRLTDNGKSIELYDAETSTTEFTIPAPFMYDAKGNRSDNVTYEVSPVKNGNYLFTVIADDNWINHQDRVFPVTIDPQILTARPEVMTFEYAQTSTNSNSYGSYIKNALKVGVSGGVKYKAKITINKQKLSLDTERIKRMMLYLTSTSQTNNTFIVNEDSENPYTQNSKVCSFDILDGFTSASGSYVFELTPSGNNYTEFYAVNGKRPYIEIEYVADDYIKHYKRAYDLVGGITGEFNVSTGEFNESFIDVAPENSVMGIPVTHHFKRSEQDFNVGDNFRLNLNETFEKNSNSQSEMSYIYTDGSGNQHGFEKHYYYYVDGVKTYVDKENVTIESDGALKYNDYSVEVEHRSDTGLKAVTTFDGLKNIEFFEYRNDEQKQLEEQIKSYKSTLKDFVLLNEVNNYVYVFEDVLNGNVAYSEFISKYNVSKKLTTTGEFIAIDTYENQLEEYERELTEGGVLDNAYGLHKSLVSVCLSLDQMRVKLDKIVRNITPLEEQNSNDILNRLNPSFNVDVKERIYDVIAIIPDSIYNNLFDDNTVYYGFTSEEAYSGKAVKDMFRQYNILLIQYRENTLTLNNSKPIAQSNLNYYLNKSTDYYQTLTTYYKELVNCQAKLEKLKKETPVNFITDGKIFKGYNENGRFVTVIDSSENYAVIEYEDYKINETQTGERIARLYDQNDNEVKFNYGKTSNLLTSIVGVNGKKVTFNYNYSTKNLTKINWYGKTKVAFSYNDYGYIENIIKDTTKVEIIRVNGKLCGLTWYNILTSTPTIIDDLVIYYEQKANTNVPKVTFEYEKTKEVVTLDDYGYLSGIYVQEDGVYTKVEKHEYVPYRLNNLVQSNPHYKIITAPKKFLYTQELPENESEWDVVTKNLNEFNKVTKQTTSKVDYITKNGVTYSKSEEINYVYDDEQNLTYEALTEKYKQNNTTAFALRTTTTNYYYNTKNQLVKTETYVSGKELTDGVQIEEKYYDVKGNVVKAVKYNSLDASSKFYTQTEYDETGKTIAEYDETGENKTTLNYLGNAVANETLPNGSKLGYGRDADDSVTSITQSTADGEENSTQKIYENDLVKKVISGNVEVEYNYTAKNKISSVKLNGVDNYIKYEYNDNITDEESGKTINSVKTTYNGGADSETVTDYLGNVIKTVYNGEVQTQNEYTPSGNLVTEQDFVTGVTSTYTYDSYDRKTGYSAVKSSNNQTLLTEEYEYDEYARLTKKREICGFSNSYAYEYKDKFDTELKAICTGALTIKPKKDVLKRNTGKEILLTYDGGNTSKIYEEQITYRKVGDHATNMPSTIRYGESKNGKYLIRDSVKYCYDNMNNISAIYQNGEILARYTYDALNRLNREDNKILGKTTLFTYDNVGNILFKREYNFTLKSIDKLEELNSVNVQYLYDNDKLINYNGESFAYDVVGNPTTYRNKPLTWAKDRQLINFNGVTFAYNGKGQRVKKNDVEYTYNSNGKLIYQTDGTNSLGYYYDVTGVCAIRYNNRTFGFRKNTQGDIIAIYNAFGEILARYTYDAWGNHTVTDVNGNDINDYGHIAHLNPFRYRGYYYDTETDLYYLQSRYYDPELGRFINADTIEYLNPETINGLNLYAYCGNNPIMNVDPSGTDWWEWLVGAAIVVAAVALSVVTAGLAAPISAAVGGGMIGAIVGGAVAGAVGGAITSFGISVAAQGVSNGFTNIDWEQVGGDTLIGAASGAVLGGLGGGLKYARAASYLKTNGIKDVKSVLNNFKGIPSVKTSNGINAYRYYDGINAAQRGRWLTNTLTNNPIKDLVLYKNNATMVSKFVINDGAKYLVGKVAKSSANVLQYFIANLDWITLIG